MIKFLSRVHLNGHTKTFHPLVVEGKFCCGGEFSMAVWLFLFLFPSATF